LIFFRQFVELPGKNQPLLDYVWNISRDWERLQRTTTHSGCLAAAVLTHSPLIAATRVQYPASACEMVMW